MEFIEYHAESEKEWLYGYPALMNTAENLNTAWRIFEASNWKNAGNTVSTL